MKPTIVLLIVALLIVGVGGVHAQTPGQDVPGSHPWLFASGHEYPLLSEVYIAATQTGIISDFDIDHITNPDGSISLVLWLKYDPEQHTQANVIYIVACQLSKTYPDTWGGHRSACTMIQ
jgi:hypothetical protein